MCLTKSLCFAGGNSFTKANMIDAYISCIEFEANCRPYTTA